MSFTQYLDQSLLVVTKLLTGGDELSSIVISLWSPKVRSENFILQILSGHFTYYEAAMLPISQPLPFHIIGLGASFPMLTR